ncbi:MAG: CAP domain-containing protein [Treponema sp.]|nr:CAP domain-containing protein [Treponema sp.]
MKKALFDGRFPGFAATMLAVVMVLSLATSCKHGGGGGGGGAVYSPSSPSSSSGGGSKNTGNSVSPTEAELAVIEEMNFARTQPQEYVAERLEPWLSWYDPPSSHSQAYLQSCIDEMNAMTPVGKLSFGTGLYIAAQKHVEVQGKGTTAEDHGHMSDWHERIRTYCNSPLVGENLAYGTDDPVLMVISLLIDEGHPDLGHRVNILHPDLTHAGAAMGSHGYFGTMCCIEFGGNGYSDK